MTRKVTACQPLNPNGPPLAFRGCGRPGICLRPKCSLSHSSAAGGAGLSFFPFDIWPQRQQSFRARGVNVPDSQLGQRLTGPLTGFSSDFPHGTLMSGHPWCAGRASARAGAVLSSGGFPGHPSDSRQSGCLRDEVSALTCWKGRFSFLRVLVICLRQTTSSGGGRARSKGWNGLSLIPFGAAQSSLAHLPKLTAIQGPG